MYDKNYFLRRLLDGATTDELAAEAADALNKASEEQRKIQELEDQKRKEMDAKELAAGKVRDAIADYCEAVGAPEDLVKEIRECELKPLITHFDALVQFVEQAQMLEFFF